MSHFHAHLRRAGVVGLALASSLAAAPAASASSHRLTATCEFPGGYLPGVDAIIDYDVATAVKAGEPTVVSTITAFKLKMRVFDMSATAVNGSLKTALVRGARRPSQRTDFRVPLTGPVDGPAWTAEIPGDWRFVVEGLALNVKASVWGVPVKFPSGPQEDSDADPYTSDLDCTLPANDAPPTVVVAGDLQPPAKLDAVLTGSASIKALVKGNVALSGALGLDIDSAGNVDGDLVFQPGSARLVAAGVLPITAKLAFVQSGTTTGTYLDSRLSTTSKVRIKVTEARAFGAIPIALGNGCQTRQLTDLNLTSDAFSVASGGVLTGTFALSDLNGCGMLNGLVSPLTASTGNTIRLDGKALPQVGAS